MISKIWKDPVWSKVISAGILGVIALIYSKLPERYTTLVINFLSESFQIPLWALLFSIALMAFAVYLFYPRKKMNITSQEWFALIAEKLSDCSYARLYLRSFDHPDEFRDEHRESLMLIISLIADKIRSGSDIKIVSYSPSSQNKTGYSWIQAELGNKFKVGDYIKVLKNQPVSNSTSMYLFDDKSVMYNKKSNGKNTYHMENYSNSIIHTLIAKGLDSLKGDEV